MKTKKKLFIIVTGVSLLIYFFSYFVLRMFFYNINGEFLYFFKSTVTQPTNSNIVVVEIDDTTYNKLGFPLDRGDYIPFLQNLSNSKPAVIGFDILFLDKGKQSIKDMQLATQFKKSGNIVIGSDIKNKNEAILPYDLFRQSVAGIGYFLPTINVNTSKVYSLKPYNELLYNQALSSFESFSFAILREYYNYIYAKEEYSITGVLGQSLYTFFGKHIPLKGGEFYISYNETKNFQRESFYNIYTGNFDSSIFKDKIVLVGYTAEGVKDDFLLPGIGNGGTTKGVYIHANAINNILNENYIIYFNELIEHLISFLFIFFIVYLNIFHLKYLHLRWISLGAISLFLTIIGIYIIVFYTTYKMSGIYLLPNYPFEFISILALSFFISAILKYRLEDKNKRLLSKALSEYVSSDIAREILTAAGQVNLSGENKKITIFFSDIAGFTTISEKLTPEQLVGFLRIYLGQMSNIIMDNKGFINKYEGDAIMALWGVFGNNTEKYGIIDACKSCLFQQAQLRVLNEEWKAAGKDELSVRMGLHVGNAIIGNIGAEGRKMEFTALGDNVNLASRLEGVNKFYGTYICVSENIYQEAKDIFTFRYLDTIRVKGKNIGINIYELISYIGEAGPLKTQIIQDFELGIQLYQKKQFQSAKEIFKKCAELGDTPARVYLKRCQLFIQTPPEENWDGIWTMDEK